MSGDPVRVPEVWWGVGQPAGLLTPHAAQRVRFLFFVISISGDPVRVPEVREGWASQPAFSRHMQLNECLPMDFYSLWIPPQETRLECQKCGEGWASQPAFSRHSTSACLWIFILCDFHLRRPGSSVRSAGRGGPASQPSRDTCNSTSASRQRRPTSASHAAKVLAISLFCDPKTIWTVVSASCIKGLVPWDFKCLFSLTVYMDTVFDLILVGWIRSHIGHVWSAGCSLLKAEGFFVAWTTTSLLEANDK